MPGTRPPIFAAVLAVLTLQPGLEVPDARAADAPPLRPPAVPLVVHDPYFSLWSPADRLTDAETVHWTGKPQPIRSLVRIDGEAARLMGTEPADLPAFPQRGVDVGPTTTTYTFGDDRVAIALKFLTPALPGDLDVLARPLTYLTWEAKSADGRPHEVQVYFDAGAELAVNTPDQLVTCDRPEVPGLRVLRVGTTAQPILDLQGDDVRIDWGHAYLAAEDRDDLEMSFADGATAFGSTGALPTESPKDHERIAAREAPPLALCWDLGRVGAEPSRRTLMLAYDDRLSIRYFDRDLPPYWRRDGLDTDGLLHAAASEFEALAETCRAFDESLTADLRRVGGEAFARIATLAYRQTLGGGKLVADANGMPLFFPKENHSNGCLATVDVIYPMAPAFLLLSPALMKASLVPVLDYAASPRWTFPYAPHDLGRYPYATGQVYGGGEKTDDRQMPVEESANMLLLMAALARAEGSVAFSGRYWPLLVTWADYLEAKGFDPEDQLCTDDFAGHLAHNVNLSAKAIVALGAFAKLAEAKGDRESAGRFGASARAFAARWVREAADGNHTRLAFDRPDTWSQKYNLVWDRVLGLGLFPPEVFRREMDFYKGAQDRYGLPLDNREDYTKLDWIAWTATLTGDRADLEALLNPVLAFLNETPDRVPMTDWYFTTTGKRRGFTARPVVGGVFIPMLADLADWHAWARRAEAVEGPWAPIPIRTTRALVPTAESGPIAWRSTTRPPGEGWMRPDFDDSSWEEAPAPFGAGNVRAGTIVRTEWKEPRIWIRREFDLPAFDPATIRLAIDHADPAEVYLNGVPALSRPGSVVGYEHFPIRPKALEALRPGRNTIAIRSGSPAGARRRGILDAGLVELGPFLDGGGDR